LSARWIVLAVLTTSYGAGAFGMLGISPLTPSLVDGFGLSRLQVALLVPSIYLGGLFFSLPGGHLADRVGVRRSFLGGLALSAAGLGVASVAPGFGAFLACLFVAGIGWSVVNPALGRAILDLFPVRERGIAMGIKQMGLTLGGLGAALVLPIVATTLGWRAAIATCAAVASVPVLTGWWVLAGLDAGNPPVAVVTAADRVARWSWLRRPALLAFFASGLLLGMVQAAVLSYLPLYAVQALGLDPVGAGLLVACSQAGGAVARLALGAASDRWLIGWRSSWLALTGLVGAAVFAGFARWPVTAPAVAAPLAFASGVGAYGWVGIFFIVSAEIGGRQAAGLLSGVAFAAIVVGLLVGPTVFGLLLVRADSYALPWGVFAALSGLVAVIALVARPPSLATDRE
jgi:ACS family hexuronate transporter-like MFS transporter